MVTAQRTVAPQNDQEEIKRRLYDLQACASVIWLLPLKLGILLENEMTWLGALNVQPEYYITRPLN